jgi:hypothetical protein
VFRPDPTIAFVAAAREQVVALIESINQPQVSIPGRPPQAAHGHLCALRNPDGTYSAFVGLYLLESAQNVVYAREPREFPSDQYVEAEAEGVHFLESLGFILDNLNFGSLAADVQETTLRRIPLFSTPKRASAPQVDAASARKTALARFLASF